MAFTNAYWTPEEDEILKAGLLSGKDLTEIQLLIPRHTRMALRQRNTKMRFLVKPAGVKNMDLVGLKFNYLTVIYLDEERSALHKGRRRRTWKCKCDCGNYTSVPQEHLLAGTQLSCGCAQRKAWRKIITKHNAHGTPEYMMWKSAHQNSKAKKIPFDIKYTDIVIPTLCPVFGKQLISGIGTGQAHHFSPSLDRFHGAPGYVKRNITVISLRANIIKSDGTLQEFEMLLKWMRRRLLERPEIFDCDDTHGATSDINYGISPVEMRKLWEANKIQREYTKYDKAMDLTGEVVNCLTVLHLDAEAKSGTHQGRRWICLCAACGEKCSIKQYYLLRGSAFSCGCVRRMSGRGLVRTHGDCHTPAYLICQGAAGHAKAINVKFDLDYRELVIPKFCPVFGFEIFTGQKLGKRTNDSASLDRFYSHFGYSKSNSEVISWRANFLKRDSTVEEIEQLVVWMRRRSAEYDAYNLVSVAM